jgi:K+-sensing histidine kinase KdpD
MSAFNYDMSKDNTIIKNAFKNLGDIKNAFKNLGDTCIGSADPSMCRGIVNEMTVNETLTEQVNEQKQLKELYTRLVGNKQEETQKEAQQIKFKQASTNAVANVNYWLYILFYLACLVLTAMLFFFSKSPSILAMSKYMKIGIILVALTYPIWISIVDQIVVFILRYLYALIAGVPYTKKVRQ